MKIVFKKYKLTKIFCTWLFIPSTSSDFLDKLCLNLGFGLDIIFFVKTLYIGGLDQSYKQFTLVIYKSRVIIGVFSSQVVKS